MVPCCAPELRRRRTARRGLAPSPVRGLARHPAGDEAGHLGRVRLLVAVVDAVVAQLGDGERDQLAHVGRVGEDLLVAGVAGVEDHLALRLALGAAGEALERLAAGERQRGLLHSSLLCTSFPSKYVRTTRPRNVHPANGLLRLRESNRWGSTFHALSVSTRITSAGAPGARVPYGRPKQRAGPLESRSTARGRASSPARTRARVSASDVSSPTTPFAARSNSTFFSSGPCGA